MSGDLIDRLLRFAAALYQRGYVCGSAGNISVRDGDGFLMTPTNSCMGFLEPDRLSRLDAEGRHVGGDRPSKELPLHMAYYRNRPGTGAVVHLHSTCATALSCLEGTDPEDAVPPITPYVVMRVGRVPVLPYTRPGAAETGDLVAARAADHAAVLLANHGPVVAGTTLEAAVYAAEELEETAKLVLMTRDLGPRRLTAAQIAELTTTFGTKGAT